MTELEVFKKLIQQFFEVVSSEPEEDIITYFEQKIVPLMHPNFKNHGPDYRETMKSNSLKDLLEGILEEKRAFPDLHYQCEAIIGENDRICYIGSFSGTHKGEIMGIKPTNNVIEGFFSQVYTIKESKIFSIRLFNDSLSLFQQIGKAVMLEDNVMQIESYFTVLKKLGLLPEKSVISR